MMLASQLTPEPQNKTQFDYSMLYDIPEYSGCYALTTFDGTILYIGQSSDISRRMNEHLGNDSKRALTPLGKVFWFYYELCDLHELDGLERGWMNHYRIKEGDFPYFNKVSPPI